MKKLADGVACVHRAGVVHKDLSPKNIMLVEEAAVWEPKLIDFGISSELAAETDAECVDTTHLGTLRYMAPEKLLHRPRSKAADIYSLGVVFLDLLSERTSDGADCRSQVARAGVRAKLQTLLYAMLEDEPTARPSAEAVRSRLEGVLEPESWTEMADRGMEHLSVDAPDEALPLFRRALGETPPDARATPAYRTLVVDSVEAVRTARQDIDWWDLLIEGVLALAPYGMSTADWDCFGQALSRASDRTSDSWSRYQQLLDRLGPLPPSAELGSLVRLLAGTQLVVDRADSQFLHLCIDYCVAGLPLEAPLHEFCVAKAREARLKLTPPIFIELWLRRARRALPSGTPAFQQESRQLDKLRERTGALQTLPNDCDQFDLELGGNEAGHDQTDRIERFANRLRSAYGFVRGVRRIRKAPHESVAAPTLLSLESAKVDLQDRGVSRDRTIAFLLDPRFTRPGGNRDACALLMAVLLPEGTTPAQRAAAYDVLASDASLFPR